MRLPRTLGVRDLPLAELSAARLDGEVYAIGPGWAPIDVVPGPADRAAAALAGTPPGWIAEGRTALWIWGGIDEPPASPHFAISSARRVSIKAFPSTRQITIDDGDTVALGGRLVTTPVRTAIDLARRGDWDERVGDEVVAMLVATMTAPDAVRAAMPGSRRLPFRRSALERLDAAFARSASTGSAPGAGSSSMPPAATAAGSAVSRC